MFEKLVFRNSTRFGPLIDIGAIAEALIFYGRVEIIGNGATIKFLLQEIPPFVLLELLKSGRLGFQYLSDQIGVRTIERPHALPVHDLVKFSSPQHTFDKEPFDLFYHRHPDKRAARQFARSLAELSHGDFDAHALQTCLLDSERTEKIVSDLLQSLAVGYANDEPLRFRLMQEQAGWIVDTNLDFVRVNNAYHKRVPKTHSSLTPAYLVSLIQGAYEELHFAGRLCSEIAVDCNMHVIHSHLLSNILERRISSSRSIEAFSELSLGSVHAVREAVNSGRATVKDILSVLERADKFREWLQSQPVDTDLVKNYYNEVVRKTWIEKLPTRGVRWGLFTGGGLVLDAMGLGGLGTAIGLSISVFDSFVLEKLLGGWKPHHFVEGTLRPLVGSSPEQERPSNSLEHRRD